MTAQKSEKSCQAMSSKPETTPLGKIALKTGVISVVTAALIGLGSFGYYGLGLSIEPSALEKFRTGTWPDEVKKKIQTTYVYFFFSFYVCMNSALFIYSNPSLFRAFTSTPMVLVDFCVQTIVQNGKLFSQLSDQNVISLQKVFWFLYCVFLGGVASPAFILGVQNGKISIHITCLLLVTLILLSLIAPVGKFASWKKTLGIYEILIFLSSVGAAVFPFTSSAGAIFFSLSFYGGLILYPANFLCHSQEAQVEASAVGPENPYCAVAASVPILLDAIRILGRMVVLSPPD